MDYLTLQGARIPVLGLGTYRLQGAACREAVADALALGYRHIDTAQTYDNEADVGRAWRAAGVAREDLFLTTKVWIDNLAPARVDASVEESLRHLQTDYVDLLLIHWPSDAVPLAATLDAMQALQAQGKARHLGVSNFTPTLLREALRHAPLLCNQVEYHPYLSQAPLLALARKHDLMLTAYSPLARARVLRDPTLQAIAARHGKTPVQVALRWLVQQPNVAAIPKAATAAHRRANLDVFSFALTDEEQQAIDGLARGQRLVDPAFAPAWES